MLPHMIPFFRLPPPDGFIIRENPVTGTAERAADAKTVFFENSLLFILFFITIYYRSGVA